MSKKRKRQQAIPVVQESEVTIQAAPGTSPAPASVTVGAPADLTRPYLAANINAYMAMLSALPQAFDDLSGQFGIDIYDQMLTDSEVSASLDVIVYAAVATPPVVDAALTPDDPDYDIAVMVADFVRNMLDGLTISLQDTLRVLVRQALAFGTALGELIYEATDDTWLISDIRVTDMRQYTLVVDGFNQIHGIAPTMLHERFPVGSVMPIYDGQVLDNVMPRSKALLLAWQPTGSDPRGKSLLRAAYAPWWAKQQIINEMVTWFARFAQPSIWGTTAEGAQDICITNPDGSQTIERPTDQLLAALMQFRNASAIALPYGSQVNAISMSQSGTVFFDGLDWADQAIRRAILKQHLATGEGQHQARAAAEVHQDILGLMILTVRNWLGDQVRRDVFRPIVLANFGDAAERFTPYLDLGDGDGFPISATEVAQLAAVGWFTSDQMAVMDKRLGLPVRGV